jgi:hypothetical protein
MARRAEDGDKPASADSVQSYIVRAFGHRLRALGRSRQNRSGR